MRNVIRTGIAAAMIFAGSMFTAAHALPVAPASAPMSEAVQLPVVEAQFYFGAPPRRVYRPHNRGYRPVYRSHRPAYRSYARPGNRYGWQRGRGNPHRNWR